MSQHIAPKNTLRPVCGSTDAAIQIIGFPPAGSGPMFFRPWKSCLPDACSLDAVNIPGRELRISEPFAASMDHLVTEVVDALQNATLDDNRPLVFFGHSFGALIAFEVCRSLQALGKRLPIALCVSAHCAPMQRTPIGAVHELNDEQLIDELQRFEGLPREVLESAEYTKLVLPIIKADLSIDYQVPLCSTQVLDIPLFILAGNSDHVAPANMMADWRKISSADSQLMCFDGSHFYIRQHLQQVIQTLGKFVQQYLTTNVFDSV